MSYGLQAADLAFEPIMLLQSPALSTHRDVNSAINKHQNKGGSNSLLVFTAQIIDGSLR